MRADYELIAKEHLEGYGAYSHHLDAFEDFYADDLHFLYELIQNAQDAIASHPNKEQRHRLLRLVLRDDELLAHNDGVPFTEKHVRAICSIRQSTKDLTQVGTHGIGFKATGKFTDAPEIFSGEENFRIRRKVIPEPIEQVTDEIAALVAQGFTVFRLPFRNDLREGSLELLAERLHHIHKWSLLFLHNLCCVEWVDERTGRHNKGIYQRSIQPHQSIPGATIVTLRAVIDEQVQSEERFLCFARKSSPPAWVVEDLLARARDLRERTRIEGSQFHPQPIEIALKLDDAGKIVPLADGAGVLFSFLPTSRESRLRFLTQAHFKTTFARDNIRDPHTFGWNRWLLDEVAALLPDALEALKSAVMMTPAVIRALPIPKEDVADGEGNARLISPILSACVTALREQPLIPTNRDGVCLRASDVFHPHNRDLRRLLSDAELAEVTGVAEAMWLHPDLRWGDNDEGDLLRAAGVQEVKPSQVVDWLASKSTSWFEGKDDTWIASLYRYLASQPLRSERERLKLSPLVRREDGSHVCATQEAVFFAPTGEEQAKLLFPLLKSLPLVRTTMLPSGNEAGSDGVNALFADLGVKPLVLLRLVTDWLLPKYQSSSHKFSREENLIHVHFLVDALAHLPQRDVTELMQAAQSVPFLLCYQGRAQAEVVYKPMVLVKTSF